MKSPQVLDMLMLNEISEIHTLKEEHQHLLQDSQPASPTNDNPPSPPSSTSSSNSSLGLFDPSMEGLRPFEEGGPDLQQNVPRSAQNIPHHPAYSIPDTTGIYTSGFMPMRVPYSAYWSCGSFTEDQSVICRAFHFKSEPQWSVTRRI